MRTPIKDSYEIIINALLADGYTEEEAEQLICDVIEDQIEFSNFAERVHEIIKGFHTFS